MPDRHGATLLPGDPVLYHHDEDQVVSATVVRDLADDRYLIQMDPRRPRPGPTSRLLRDAADLGIDPQEPFEVAGREVEFFGNWDEEGEADEEEQTPRG